MNQTQELYKSHLNGPRVGFERPDAWLKKISRVTKFGSGGWLPCLHWFCSAIDYLDSFSTKIAITGLRIPKHVLDIILHNSGLKNVTWGCKCNICAPIKHILHLSKQKQVTYHNVFMVGVPKATGYTRPSLLWKSWNLGNLLHHMPSCSNRQYKNNWQYSHNIKAEGG